MKSRCTFSILSCLVCLCHYQFTLQWPGNHLNSYINKEFHVTGEDLKECEHQRNVCVTESEDCGSSFSSHGNDMFLNISCHYLVHEKSFGCKWVYFSDVKAKMIDSFIFTQTTDFSHCPSIFNPLEEFNVTIKSKDANADMYSDVYPVSIEEITQAPRPVNISMKATEATLNVTWNSLRQSQECKIRYKQSTMKQWTEEKDYGLFHVISGLQPFSQYSVTVACVGSYGLWSNWSAVFEGMTLEGVPTASPPASYCVEPLDYSSSRIFLMWKALDISEARGVILGYEVTYKSTKQASLETVNTTDLKAVLEVAAGDYSVTLRAYNSAGLSPVHHININTLLSECLPRVKGLWASSGAGSLRIRWQTAEAVSVSEFAIEWSSFSDAKQWRRVNGSTFSTLLTDSIKALETYSISVYPIYGDLCGPPESIQASLESGTLFDVVQLRPMNMTKTSLTVRWVWLRKAPKTKVLQYRLEIRSEDEIRSLIIFPDQWQHSFYNLQTNVEYSVDIYGETNTGDFLKENIQMTTLLLEKDEVIKAVVPVALLLIGFGLFSVLSRTVYKDYFFPNIANPGHSLIGRWLLNPLHVGDAFMSVQKLDDFSRTGQSFEKCLIQMENQTSSDKEVFEEDGMYLPDDCSTRDSDSMESSQASPALTEYVDLPLFPDNFGYVDNGNIPNTG